MLTSMRKLLSFFTISSDRITDRKGTTFYKRQFGQLRRTIGELSLSGIKCRTVMAIVFVNRAAFVTITDGLPNNGSDVAFVNINPIYIIDEGKGLLYTIPRFFVSDGASVPEMLRSIGQPVEFIQGGHIHDAFYAKGVVTRQPEFRTGQGLQRATADRFLREYLRQHCPRINALSQMMIVKAVEVFGGRYFHNPAGDEWRTAVARVAWGDSAKCAGNGRGLPGTTARRTIVKLTDLTTRRWIK